jgi:hypothetical protein
VSDPAASWTTSRAIFVKLRETTSSLDKLEYSGEIDTHATDTGPVMFRRFNRNSQKLDHTGWYVALQTKC